MKYKKPSDAIKMIEKNRGKVGAKTIKHPEPGIKVLGAIDYLINHCGYESWSKS